MSGVQFDIRVVTGGSGSAVDGLISSMTKATGSANTLNSVLSKLGGAAFHLNNIRSAMSGFMQDLTAINAPGMAFNDQMKDLQAITGVTNDQLAIISKSARQNAKDFGIDAAQGVESYKLILSQLGPEIAKTPAALAAMGRNASVLSKQMAGDVTSATQVLTTAMNQYGVSLDDPIQASKTMAVMMDIMSNAAQEGSAELPQIKSALEQAGMMAKTSNVSFAELNATIQVLDKAGKKGAEGGVAIRNVLAEMSQGAMNSPKTIAMLNAAHISITKLADNSLTFSQRLQMLKPIANDAAAMTQLFGKENVAAAMALVQNTSEIDSLTEKTLKSGTAQEMANTKMESWNERLARANAWLKDLGISITNATSGFIPFLQMGMGGIQVMANLAMITQVFGKSALSSAIKGIGSLLVSMGSWIATTTMATLAQWGLNAAMYANPIGIVIAAVVAVIAAVAALIYWWDEIWATIKGFGAWLIRNNPFQWMIDIVDFIFPGFRDAMTKLWDWIVGKFEALVGWFKKAWGWIKSLFGAGEDKTTQEASKAAVEEMAKQVKATNIEGITVQGTVKNDSPLKDYKPGGKGKGSSGGELSSNITSGGSKPTTIYLTIQKMQDKIEIHTTDLKSGAQQVANTVTDELLIALNSVDAKLNQ